MAETKEQVMHTPYVVLHTGVDFSILDERGLAVATVAQDKIAELIVRAVNCHEDLLQEARWMHAVLLQSEKHLMPDERDHLEEIALVIAKAEGR